LGACAREHSAMPPSSELARPAEVGAAAGDFSLADEAGREVALSSFSGTKVLLWWYPKADTGG